MEITVHEVKDLMDRGEDFLLIDVREPFEHDAFNIGGELIPLGDFPSAVASLRPHRDRKIIMYCRSGRRSGISQQMLLDNGFEDVWNMTGGVLAWQAAFPE